MAQIDDRHAGDRDAERDAALPQGDGLKCQNQAEQRRDRARAANCPRRIEQARRPDNPLPARADVGGGAQRAPGENGGQLARHPPAGIVDLQHADD